MAEPTPAQPTTPTYAASTRLDRFDREILRYMIAWAPYKGPHDEETVPEFGLYATEMRHRCAAIISNSWSSNLAESDRDLVSKAARVLDIRPRTALNDASLIRQGRAAPSGGGRRRRRGVWTWTKN
jgi:hypothetical protein